MPNPQYILIHFLIDFLAAAIVLAIDWYFQHKDNQNVDKHLTKELGEIKKLILEKKK